MEKKRRTENMMGLSKLTFHGSSQISINKSLPKNQRTEEDIETSAMKSKAFLCSSGLISINENDLPFEGENFNPKNKEGAGEFKKLPTQMKSFAACTTSPSLPVESRENLNQISTYGADFKLSLVKETTKRAVFDFMMEEDNEEAKQLNISKQSLEMDDKSASFEDENNESSSSTDSLIMEFDAKESAPKLNNNDESSLNGFELVRDSIADEIRPPKYIEKYEVVDLDRFILPEKEIVTEQANLTSISDSNCSKSFHDSISCYFESKLNRPVHRKSSISLESINSEPDRIHLYQSDIFDSSGLKEESAKIIEQVATLTTPKASQPYPRLNRGILERTPSLGARPVNRSTIYFNSQATIRLANF